MAPSSIVPIATVVVIQSNVMTDNTAAHQKASADITGKISMVTALNTVFRQDFLKCQAQAMPARP